MNSSRKSMQAGVFVAPGEIHCQQRPVPEIEDGDVLVKVASAGICGTDLHTYRHGGYTPPGLIIGHEFCGRVESVGASVEGIEIGERVCINPMPDIGLFRDGAFAEYVCVKNGVRNQNVLPMPAGMSDEEGALIEPLAVALHGINRCELSADSKVLILGAGAIGLCCQLLLQAKGIDALLVADLAPGRLEFARKLGAATVDVATQNLHEVAVEMFGRVEGFIPSPAIDVVFDCTGSEKALQDAIGLVKSTGTIVVLGTYAAPPSVEMTLLVAKEIQLLGSCAYDVEFSEALALVAEGRIDPTVLISHRYPLSQIDQAFRQQAVADEAIKVLLQIS
jgi:2-desacetyl-2-hydroxyethyl bacteriochlorophyllide A dehydrogenase